MKTRLYRQGDVLLREVKTIPKTLKEQKPEGRIVLAYGEVTGHKHQIAESVEVYVGEAGELYLKVTEEGVTLRHEEHGAIVLPPGNYERVIQREYSPEAIRNVMD